VFGKSLFRSTWRVFNAQEQQLAVAQERSLPMAIARRAVDFVPYGEWVPIPYNFDLLVDGRVAGHLNRKFQLRDRYILDLSGDSDRRVDRRLAIALAIGLDTLQNR
jgi:DNA-binding transcriptional regulator LsrR (DeoR family)